MIIPSWIEPQEPGQPDPVVEYYPNSQIVKSVQYFNTENQLHRMDGPAFINWFENGVVIETRWYQNDNLHREDGPARELWYHDYTKHMEQWYINHKRHRTDGPADTYWQADGQIVSQEWYEHGEYLGESAERVAAKLNKIRAAMSDIDKAAAKRLQALSTRI